MKQFFDAYAVDYDGHFTQSAIGRCQRNQVWHYLTENLGSKPLRILELNCGTGEDAVWLARQGHSVVATDLSEVMVNITREKALVGGFQDQIEVFQSGIEDITKERFSAPFDLIFSNFGGWNCLSPEQVLAAANNLKECLAPTGKIISVIMPDRCLWEQGYFLAKRNFQAAKRRRRGITQFVDTNNIPHPLYYFSPKNFAKWWGDGWARISFKAIGLWVPPSYLNPHFENRPQLLSWLHRRDLASRSKVGARFADHAIITLERSSAV